MTEEDKTEREAVFDAPSFFVELQLCEYVQEAENMLYHVALEGHMQTIPLFEQALRIIAKRRTRAFTVHELTRWAARAGLDLDEEQTAACLNSINSAVPSLNPHYANALDGELSAYKALLPQDVQSTARRVNPALAPLTNAPWYYGQNAITFPPTFDATKHKDKAFAMPQEDSPEINCLKAFIDVESMRKGYSLDEATQTSLVLTMYEMNAQKIAKSALRFLLRNNLYFEACRETIANGVPAFSHAAAPSWVQTSLLESDPLLPAGQALHSYKEAFQPANGVQFAQKLNAYLRALRHVIADEPLGKVDIFLNTIYACGYVCFMADLFTPNVYLGADFLKEHLASLTKHISMPYNLQIPDLLVESYEAFANLAMPTYKAHEDPLSFLLEYTKLLVRLSGYEEDSVHRWLPVLAVSVNIFNTCNEVLKEYFLLPLE